jgi:hypothetical protein
MTEWTVNTLLELIKMAAAPVNFDQLIANGVLRKYGTRYEVLDLARLPEHARRKVRAITRSRETPNLVVSFSNPGKRAVRLARKLSLLPQSIRYKWGGVQDPPTVELTRCDARCN